MSTSACITARAAGVDTWSPAWYVDPESTAARAMQALATSQTKRGAQLPDAVGDYRFGWFPGSCLIYAEGHPARDGALCSADALQDELRAVVGAMADLGIQLPTGQACELEGAPRRPGLAGLRRADLTVDLEVGSGADGLAVLAGMGSIEVPRLRSETIRERGGRAVETVSWKGARGIHARMYDKGVESGTAPRGELLRMEAQLRYQAGGRLDPRTLNAHHARALFGARFAPLWQATKGVTVVGALAVPARLQKRVDSGEMTEAQADRVVGFLVREAQGLTRGHSERTAYRRRAELRALGLVAADGVLDEIEVDLSSVLAACDAPETWGAG